MVMTDEAKNSAWTSTLWTIAAPIAQASAWNPVGGRVRTVAGVWLLLALVLSTVFRANLKAMLILPRLQLPFGSLEELIKSGIPTYIPKATVFHKAILTRSCPLYLVPCPFKGGWYHIFFPKSSSLKPIVDNILVRLQETGILEKIVMEDVRHAKECLKSRSQAVLNSLRPLELGDFYGILSLYCGGEH
ncbi:hypothetical protein Pcinc_003137 [Petrolisthes cinctipes]|uniref:Ionotropic glutamate receptor C-terminal domain-containing protein n=1 Tax=Petrolisthes cinctipes TaxID=88211 RepID=A0AAE1L283_PETCI|nr:hypothetical protein Pcinc_003137 [Petrolisthes cinctipes]